MFSILQNQVNVSDIVNKSSVNFFYYILKYLAKKNSGLVVVQNKNYLTCKKRTDQLKSNSSPSS